MNAIDGEVKQRPRCGVSLRVTLFGGLALLISALIVGHRAEAQDDPFAAGVDALAVNEADMSSSLRAKLKLRKMEPDMVQVQVRRVDDTHFPDCTFFGKVLTSPKSKAKHFKLIRRGKVYRFAPALKRKGGRIDLKDATTQSNLGACYYPKKSKVVVKLSGVDLKRKVVQVAALYLK